MLDVHIISNRPHSEEDITSKRPIQWKLGKVEFTFPIFSYKDYVDFDKSLRVLFAQSLMVDTYPSDEDFQQSLTRIYGLNPELYLLDDSNVPLLPAYIMKFARPQNKKDFIEKYNTWADENPTKQNAGTQGIGVSGKQVLGIDEKSEGFIFHLAMIDYLINNAGVLDLYKLFKDLLWLQYNIKKKVLEILKEEKEVVREDLKPQSSATVIQWESIRKKRSKKRLMSTSSQ
jgi:hypothetical protein